jgi:hypothetical protein
LEKTHSCLSALGTAGRRLEEESRAKATRHALVILSNNDAITNVFEALSRLSWEDKGAAVPARIEALGTALGEELIHLMGMYDKRSDKVRTLVSWQIAVWFAKELEKFISLRRKLSLSCAVALEGLLHAMIQSLRPFCGAIELRSSFERVSHICTVIAVETAADASELWDSTWPLTPNEVRSVVAKRIDFSAKDVAALKFKQ